MSGKETAHQKHLRLYLEKSLDEFGVKPHQYGAWLRDNTDDFVLLTKTFIRSRVQ